jgi:hypothetical protein
LGLTSKVQARVLSGKHNSVETTGQNMLYQQDEKKRNDFWCCNQLWVATILTNIDNYNALNNAMGQG